MHPPNGNAPLLAESEARSNDADGRPDKSTKGQIITTCQSVSAPDALRTLDGWLIWRYEQNPGEQKPRKVPYYAGSRQRRRGENGSAEDRRQLVTFDKALATMQAGKFDGIGLAMLEDWGIVALDFDNCVQDGQLAHEVEQLVAGTYAEYSPSGRGVRAFMRGNLGNPKSLKDPFDIEFFSSKGYVTFTGRTLEICELIGNENTVADLTPEVLDLYEQRFGLPIAPPTTGELTAVSLTREQIETCLAAFPGDLPYESSTGPNWLGIGMALHHETDGSDAGFHLWDVWSAKSPKYSSREYGESKWRSFGKGGQKSITGRSLVKWANEHGAGISLSVATADDFEDLGPLAISARKPRTASEILAKRFDPLRWVVPKILPEGVFLLVASPKIGKSWLALQMALAVATGSDILGEKAEQGAALYLALEDNDRRLQARLRELDADMILSAHSGAALQFETEWPRAGAGGPEAIDAWLAEHPGARLVVVDVLERFRPQRKAKGNLYAEDYEALRALKAIADRRRLGILVVHHTRKGITEDPMEMVSGTQGLAGSADGMLMLERARGETRGRLHVIGRDIEDDGEYVVEFSKCRWTMLGTTRTVASTLERQEVLDALKNAGGPMTAAEIAEAIGKKRTTVARLLTKCVTDGVTTKAGTRYAPAGAE